MAEDQELQRMLIGLAKSWGNAIKVGDHKAANTTNAAIERVVNGFRSNKQLSKAVLAPLLTHTDPSVRLCGSVYCLDLGIQIQVAEDTLANLSTDPNIHVIRSMAQINFSKWKIGKKQDR